MSLNFYILLIYHNGDDHGHLLSAIHSLSKSCTWTVPACSGYVPMSNRWLFIQGNARGNYYNRMYIKLFERDNKELINRYGFVQVTILKHV